MTYENPPNGFSIEEIRRRHLLRFTSWAEDDRAFLLDLVDRQSAQIAQLERQIELLQGK